MPEPRTGRGATALVRKIAQFRSDSSGETNLYPFIRDLLVNPAFGIGLKSDQVVVDSERFGVCFAEVRPAHVALEEQLKDFRDGKTRYAFQSIDELGKHHFTDTIREIASILSGAVTQLVDTKVVADLTTANGLLQEIETRWGPVVYDWNSVGFPIEFTNIVDERIARTVPTRTSQNTRKRMTDWRLT